MNREKSSKGIPIGRRMSSRKGAHMKQIKNRFFAKYSKSSAFVVTLILHAILVVGGVSMVVVQNIVREPPPEFTHAVSYHKPMPKPRIRPPKTAQKPKVMRPEFQRIPVKGVVDRKTPSIKVAEFAGFKGQFGSAHSSGSDLVSTIGFSMPEINMIGVRARGEKIFIILDCGDHMLVDEMGGIPAYTIIKEELIRIVRDLPSTALFNVCVFGNGRTQTLFPKLVSANQSNAASIERWLTPLNAMAASVASGEYGIRTLGEGGIKQGDDFRVGRFADQMDDVEREYRAERWYTASMVAMQQQADTVFLLTNTWGRQRMVAEKQERRSGEWFGTSAGKRWTECIEASRLKLAEENARRKAAGKPPRVIANGNWGRVLAYYPDIIAPPRPEYYYFSAKDFYDAFEFTRTKFCSKGMAVKVGLKGRRKDAYTFNVVQFVPSNSSGCSKVEKFQQLTRLCKGEYKTVAGLKAIEAYLNSARK